MKDDTKRTIYIELFKRSGFEIEELPGSAWALLKDVSYRHLIVGMVREDRPFMSKSDLMKKYGITLGQLDAILYPHNPVTGTRSRKRKIKV